MSRIIVHDFLTIADHLATLDWPLTLDQFPPHAHTLGWTPTNKPDRYELHNPVESKTVWVDTSNDKIDQVGFALVKRGNTVAEDNDAFIEATTLARHHWGTPYRLDPGHLASIGWRLPNNCRAEISQGIIVKLYFYTPTGWYLY